ncbi:MAG: NCS2 family permease [Burkholderiales bacterium]|nr:NCS2 family permease [Opitutaceae bacterium]
MKAFVKGDIDGFFALGLDSLINLLLMSGFCLGLMDFSSELFYGKILPGMAVGVVAGNLFYAWQARRLGRREGRDDACAIPFGINLITVVVYSLLVMYPAQQAALADGFAKADADNIAWIAGIGACLGSGLIEFFGAFVVRHLKRVTPLAAMLAALAGIGVFFIAMDFMFRAWTYPLIGMSTLAIALLIYFGGMRFKFGIPGGLVLVAVGALGSWGLHWAGLPSPVSTAPADLAQLGLHLPTPMLGAVWASLEYLLPFFSIIVPMGLVNVVGSLQCLASAEVAGDAYEPRSSLLVNGATTLVAACFGSPYPTTIYIGHPGWKLIGARAGYSTLNALFVTLVCLTGSLGFVARAIPIEAGMAILIWIGITMGSQAFDAVPRRHIPAVIVGLFPAIAGYCALVAKNVLGGAGVGTPENPYRAELVADILARRNFFAEGMFALDQGYFFSCLILAAATVCIIDQKFRAAAAWFLSGAVLSACGLIHHFTYVTGDIVGLLAPGWKWVAGYASMAAIMLLLPPVMVKSRDAPLI